MMLQRWIVMAGCLCATLGFGSGRAADVPYGSKDFYPSADRPVGFRGDGNGWFPGATPVAEWWEGTPIKTNVTDFGRQSLPVVGTGWDFADARSTNIVWKVEMPSWVNSQPIVVGDRVFSYGEPDFLFCNDAHTGRLLWQRSLNPWLLAGLETNTAATCRALSDVLWALDAVIGMQFHFNTCGRYLSTNEYDHLATLFVEKDLPILLARLRTIDAQGEYDAAAQVTAATFREFMGKTGADGKDCWDAEKKLREGRTPLQLREQVQQRIWALAGGRDKVQVPVGTPWGNMVGWNMSVPVSDGTHVYAHMGQGQTACFDLDGNLRWSTLHPYGRKGPSTHHVISPLLVGNILVDMHSQNTLRGLDKDTGKLVWETPVATSRKSTKSGYYVAGHIVLRVEGQPVIVTSQCNLLRPSDGKILGEYDYGDAWHGGPPIAGLGDLFLKAANGDGWDRPFKAFRLTLKGETASAAQVWECVDVKGSYTTRVVLPGFAVLSGERGSIVDNETGRIVVREPFGRGYRIVAGTTLISWEYRTSGGFTSDWCLRRPDGRGFMPFEAVDLADPTAPKVLSRRNVLGGDEPPRYAGVEELIPNSWADKTFFNADGGKPPQIVHTDTCLFPSGNRLFIRTCGYLYCIGDPAVKYDWNPPSKAR